jgi:hypothetical protein
VQLSTQAEAAWTAAAVRSIAAANASDLTGFWEKIFICIPKKVKGKITAFIDPARPGRWINHSRSTEFVISNSTSGNLLRAERELAPARHIQMGEVKNLYHSRCRSILGAGTSLDSIQHHTYEILYLYNC